jgi:hypothetical protein
VSAGKAEGVAGLPRLERDDLPRLMSWRVGVRRLTVTSEVNVLQSIGGGNNDSLSMAVFRVERQSTELGNVVLEAGYASNVYIASQFG